MSAELLAFHSTSKNTFSFYFFLFHEGWGRVEAQLKKKHGGRSQGSQQQKSEVGDKFGVPGGF